VRGFGDDTCGSIEFGSVGCEHIGHCGGS